MTSFWRDSLFFEAHKARQSIHIFTCDYFDDLCGRDVYKSAIDCNIWEVSQGILDNIVELFDLVNCVVLKNIKKSKLFSS